jgi:hypothetical protein
VARNTEPRRRRASPSQRARERAWRAYCGGTASLKDIGRDIGLTPAAFLARRKAWGWPPRNEARQAAAQRAGAADTADAAPPPGPKRGRRDIVARVHAAVERELAAVEDALVRTGGEGRAERSARTLASLVKTLAELKRLDGGADRGDSGDGGGGDLDDIRRSLARRLAGLRESRAGG